MIFTIYYCNGYKYFIYINLDKSINFLYNLNIIFIKIEKLVLKF